jgi:hypothetical protein
VSCCYEEECSFGLHDLLTEKLEKQVNTFLGLRQVNTYLNLKQVNTKENLRQVIIAFYIGNGLVPFKRGRLTLKLVKSSFQLELKPVFLLHFKPGTKENNKD